MIFLLLEFAHTSHVHRFSIQSQILNTGGIFAAKVIHYKDLYH